jgi:hypothetical protein
MPVVVVLSPELCQFFTAATVEFIRPRGDVATV